MTGQELPQASPGGSVPARGLGLVPLLLTSPSEVFRRLAPNPQWLGPFLLFLVIIAAATYVRMDQDLHYQTDVAVGMMERMGLSDADIDEALAGMPDPNGRTPATVSLHVGQATLGVALFGFLGALVLWVVAKVFGSTAGFRAALSVYWMANLGAALGYLVLAVMVRLADTVQVSLGLGGLIGLEWGTVPHLLLEVLNPFSLVTLWLLGTGAGIVFRTSKSAGWTIGGTHWALSTLVAFAFQVFGSWASGRL